MRNSVHRYRAVEFSALSEDELQRWRELRDANPQLDSPYFHPSFSAAVAAACSRVLVVVGEDADGRILSFLPLQTKGRSATAVGYPAADFQGPICAPDTDFDVPATMRSAKVTSLHFDHLREGTGIAERWISVERDSPFVDISGGLDGYLSRATRAGKDNLGQARRHARKAERDVGPYRFVADTQDPDLLERVIELKRSQYRATGARDYFASPEHRRLMSVLLAERDPDFRGMLSAVYAGDELLAAHFGLRSRSILHWWFPVYDPAYGRLGPGWLLLRALIEGASDLGLERLDLGRGEDEYKRRAMTGRQVVTEASVDLNPLRRQVLRAKRRAVQRAKQSRLGPALRSAVHAARRRRD